MDPRMEAKKKVLTELRTLARAKMAEGLKAKFHPPAPEPKIEEPKVPLASEPEGEEGEEDDAEKLLSLLGD